MSSDRHPKKQAVVADILAGMTNRQICRAHGVASSTVSKWETAIREGRCEIAKSMVRDAIPQLVPAPLKTSIVPATSRQERMAAAVEETFLATMSMLTGLARSIEEAAASQTKEPNELVELAGLVSERCVRVLEVASGALREQPRPPTT